jgi:hypothetical protein
MKKTAAKSYALRIEPQLVKPLQDLKKHNRRSLNAEINAALETWVATARATDAAREDPAPVPSTPGAGAGAKDKRKSTRKQAEVRVTPADSAPGE